MERDQDPLKDGRTLETVAKALVDDCEGSCGKYPEASLK
jgi:hypothetical protein